jgi:phosphate transport system substrate-binding protein
MSFAWRHLRRRGIAIYVAVMPVLASAQGGPPAYVATKRVTGVIRICGSPQMGDLQRLYEDGFHHVQPQVRFENDLRSTITAVSGVYQEHADIGLLGREIWPTEEQAFISAKSHRPTMIEVATGSYDVPKATFALMIFVARANPLARLSVQQLASIFGEDPSRRAATASKSLTWGDLGLKGKWARRPIHLYGFSRDNDKAQIFSKLVFRHGEQWRRSLHEYVNDGGPNGMDAGELILRAVAADPDGIGISNVHYATPAVRALSILVSGVAVAPSRASVENRSYPLSRAVYMVVDRQTESAADVEFLRFVLSRQGQEAVEREGNYLPLAAEAASKQLRGLAAN